MDIIWVIIVLSGIFGSWFLVKNFNEKTEPEIDPNENEEVDLTKEENLGV